MDPSVSTIRNYLASKTLRQTALFFFSLIDLGTETETSGDITQFFAFIIKCGNLSCYIATLLARNASVRRKNMLGQPKTSFYNTVYKEHTHYDIAWFL